MKTLMVTFMVTALVIGLGCQSTKASKQGGIAPVNEQFSIVVPTSSKVTQGTETTIDVSLNRGAYFKRDVKLEIEADGIHVTPSIILVEASDLPDVKLKIAADQDAAIGEYSVSVKGTPASGEPAAVKFTVKVEAPEIIKNSTEASK